MRFSQGHLPSCQTLAAIGSLAMHVHGALLLRNMVTEDSDGYTITFPKHLNAPVKVPFKEVAPVEFEDRADAFAREALNLIRGAFPKQSFFWLNYPDKPAHVSGDEIVRVLELAYAKYLRSAEPHKYSSVQESDPLRVYRHKSFHYQSDDSLRDFTGWTVETLAAKDIPSESSQSFAERAVKNPALKQAVFNKLTELSSNPSKFVVTTCTKGNPGSMVYHDPGGKIVPWHDHIVSEVNWQRKTINVIDPYNSKIAMVLDWDDYCQYFYLLSIAHVPDQLLAAAAAGS